MTIDEAQTARDLAAKAAGAAYVAKNNALYSVEAEHGPIIEATRSRLAEAEEALRLSIAANTPDHPLQGRRVFKMEETRKYSYQPSRKVRVDGEVTTYRPDDAKPTYGGIQPGDAIVLPLLKSGKLGKRPLAYSNWSGKPDWEFAD